MIRCFKRKRPAVCRWAPELEDSSPGELHTSVGGWFAELFHPTPDKGGGRKKKTWGARRVVPLDLGFSERTRGAKDARGEARTLPTPSGLFVLPNDGRKRFFVELWFLATLLFIYRILGYVLPAATDCFTFRKPAETWGHYTVNFIEFTF